MPWKRGFDTFYGYLTGSELHYTKEQRSARGSPGNASNKLLYPDFRSETGPIQSVCVTVPPHELGSQMGLARQQHQQFCGGSSPSPPGSEVAATIGRECQRILGPAILQAVAQASSANWTYYAGALVAGDDLGSGNLTLADAQARCIGLDGCVGFTFEAENPSSISCQHKKCHYYFKSKINLNTDSAWGTWTVQPMVNPPNPHRTDPTCYSAHMFGAEAVRVINSYALSAHGDSPLFLYLAMQDVHEPISAPAKYIALHQDIDDGTRRTYAAMVSAMDEAIGNVTSSLKAADMWSECVFVISNGECVANLWACAYRITLEHGMPIQVCALLQ